MTWTERLREAAYTSPSGERIVFSYEDVSRTVEKKTSSFDFPDADGTYVQDNGATSRRYPMRVIFHGRDYDLEANLFEALLLERGVGKLDHPIYGQVDVVPFGQISRRDQLKSAANQAIIEVTFWATIGLVYPTSQQDPASEVEAALAAYEEAMANEYGAFTDLVMAVEQSTVVNTFNQLLDTTRSGLEAVAKTREDAERAFNSIYRSISTGLNELINTPDVLAAQTQRFIQIPSLATADITSRLAAFRGLSDGITTGANESDNNIFRTKDVYASTYAAGSIRSTINNTFTTRPEALEAADFILEQHDSLVEWRDNNFEALAEIDTGASYQKLLDAVSICAGFLVEISFTLKQERRITLTRARTIVDLAAELYGEVDPQLDFFINSNGLTGSEILEVPRGREIVYYV